MRTANFVRGSSAISRLAQPRLGLQARRPLAIGGPSYKFISEPRCVTILGVPLAHGQPLPGVQAGPSVMRAAGLKRKLEADGWRVDDHGDLEFPFIECSEEERKSNMKFAAHIGAANKVLAEEVQRHAARGRFVLSLGGDHSLGIGSVAGLLRARPDAAVIWVDAHADINTPQTSGSGNIHGMSVAFAMGLHDTKRIKGFEWLQASPDLKPNRLVYIGLRDIDPPEKLLIRELGIRAFTMQDVDKHGIGKVMEMAIDHATARVERPIHLSLDIDSIDPTFAPSTGTRVFGGLTYREAYFIAESLAGTGLLASMDLVEVNPDIFDEKAAMMTANMAVGLACSALGNRIL